jgi:type I restriction enzyme S subunit
VSGTTPSTTNPEYWNGGLNWVTPAEINGHTKVIRSTERKITEAAVRASGMKSFPAGTVLLSSRAPIGKVAIAGTEMYCNQGFKNLICSERILNDYLYHFLNSKTDYLNSLGRGATFKEMSKAIVEDIEIKLPDIEKQRHVADVLDKISKLMDLIKQQMALIDLLVKSRFVTKGLIGLEVAI